MLILTRKEGENVKVFENDNIKEILMQVTVLEIRGCQVRLGFDAPDKCTILRDEVYRETAAKKNIIPIKDKFTKEEILSRKREYDDRLDEE